MLIIFQRPENREELFNLRHAKAQNVVERIFGIIKKRWDILTRPPRYDMDIQAHIPPALCALHNFIMKYNPTDVEEYLDDLWPTDLNCGIWDSSMGNLAEDRVDHTERNQANAFRDQIAQQMWDQYQQYLHEHPE